MATSTVQRAATFVLRDLIGEILYFPVWWFSVGLAAAGRTLVRHWRRTYDALGLRFLLRTMFKPMYGDYSRTGRVISFFIRLILVGWKTLLLILWTVVYIGLMTAWVAGPIVAVAMILRQLIVR